MQRPLAIYCLAISLGLFACNSKDRSTETKRSKGQFKKIELVKRSFDWQGKKYEQLVPSTSSGYQESNKTWVGGARFSDFNFNLHLIVASRPGATLPAASRKSQRYPDRDFKATPNGYTYVSNFGKSGTLKYLRFERDSDSDSSPGIECDVSAVYATPKLSSDTKIPGAEELVILKKVCDSLKRLD